MKISASLYIKKLCNLFRIRTRHRQEISCKDIEIKSNTGMSIITWWVSEGTNIVFLKCYDMYIQDTGQLHKFFNVNICILQSLAVPITIQAIVWKIYQNFLILGSRNS